MSRRIRSSSSKSARKEVLFFFIPRHVASGACLPPPPSQTFFFTIGVFFIRWVPIQQCLYRVIFFIEIISLTPYEIKNSLSLSPRLQNIYTLFFRARFEPIFFLLTFFVI